MKETGKAFHNRKSKEQRPEGDFYSSQPSLIWVAWPLIKKEFKRNLILEPCSGMGALSDTLRQYCAVETNDLFYQQACFHEDYLETNIFKNHKQIITNPPFSKWDDFVLKAKTHCEKFMFIGKANFYGAASRSLIPEFPLEKEKKRKEIWKNIKHVAFFNRYIDYQTPYRQDGLFHLGGLQTAWFLWEVGFTDIPTFSILDIDRYAKLGQYLRICKQCSKVIKPIHNLDSVVWKCENCGNEQSRIALKNKFKEINI